MEILTPILLLILTVAVVVIGGFLAVLLRRSKSDPNSLTDTFDPLFSKVYTTMEEGFTRGRKELRETYDANEKKIEQRLRILGETLVKLEASDERLGENVENFTKIIMNPKRAGSWGEGQCDQILKTFLIPELYEKETYRQNGDRRVRFDFLLKFEDPPGPIGIDSKFPSGLYTKIEQAESEEERNTATGDFKKEVKKMINEISNKYIIPDVTAENAIMFIPSEAIIRYIYEVHPDLLEEAEKAFILLASPQTLALVVQVYRSASERIQLVRKAKEVHSYARLMFEESGSFLKTTETLKTRMKGVQNLIGTLHSGATRIRERSTKFKQGNNNEEQAEYTLEETSDKLGETLGNGDSLNLDEDSASSQ